MRKQPLTLRSTRRARTPEEIAAHDKAVKEREAARESRRQKWLAAQLENINSAICHADAIELLREACEAWEGVE